MKKRGFSTVLCCRPMAAVLLAAVLGVLLCFGFSGCSGKSDVVFPMFYPRDVDYNAKASALEAKFLSAEEVVDENGEPQIRLKLDRVYDWIVGTGVTTDDSVYYREPGGTQWYVVYTPVLSPAKTADAMGIAPRWETIEFDVPVNTFAAKGAYVFVGGDGGKCELPLEEMGLGDLPDFHFDGVHFPTETGFPAYQRVNHFKPIYDYDDDVDHISTELIEGEKEDTLCLSIKVKKSSNYRNRFTMLYQDPEDEKLRQIYEGRIDPEQEDIELSIEPGEYRFEFQLPHDLLKTRGKERGTYYLFINGWETFKVSE